MMKQHESGVGVVNTDDSAYARRMNEINLIKKKKIETDELELIKSKVAYLEEAVTALTKKATT